MDIELTPCDANIRVICDGIEMDPCILRSKPTLDIEGVDGFPGLAGHVPGLTFDGGLLLVPANLLHHLHNNNDRSSFLKGTMSRYLTRFFWIKRLYLGPT